MNAFRLAIRNILDKPLNLLLSIILFALGVGLINFLILFNHQLKDKFESNLAEIDLVLGAKGSPLQLILCNMYHIDNPTGNIKIGDAKPFLNPKHPIIASAVPLSLGDNYKNFRIVGTNYGFTELYKAKIAQGKLWEAPLEVTIGQQVADETNLKIGDTFTSSHGFTDDVDLAHDHNAFKVVGILAPTGAVIDQLIMTQTSTIWQVHKHEEEATQTTAEDEHDHAEGEEHDHDHIEEPQKEVSNFPLGSNEELLTHPEESITSILVKYKSRTSFQALNMPRMVNENTSLQAAAPAYEINKLVDMVGVGTDGIKAIAYLIGFVSALSIFISLYRAMRDRKYELALIRVMGGKRSYIFNLILLEGFLLALIGWTVGTILSHVSMEIMAGYLKSDFRYSFSGWIWLKEEWFLLAISLFIGVLSALIPALSAAKRDINEVLDKG